MKSTLDELRIIIAFKILNAVLYILPSSARKQYSNHLFEYAKQCIMDELN